MQLSGHKVLVTGGGSGIGLALARGLVARGNQVMICGRDGERLARAAGEVPGLQYVACDLAREEELAPLVATVRERLGGLSLLVNNAAVQLHYGFLDTAAPEAFRQIDQELDINLNAVMKLTVLSLPLLQKEAGGAAILNVSSGLGLVPKRSAPVYCASKAGVHLFSKALRYQLEDAGSPVALFEAIPPMVDTPMTQGRGSRKLTAEQAAAEILSAMEANRYEIRVGAVKLLVWLQRLVPKVADRILRNG